MTYKAERVSLHVSFFSSVQLSDAVRAREQVQRRRWTEERGEKQRECWIHQERRRREEAGSSVRMRVPALPASLFALWPCCAPSVLSVPVCALCRACEPTAPAVPEGQQGGVQTQCRCIHGTQQLRGVPVASAANHGFN